MDEEQRRIYTAAYAKLSKGGAPPNVNVLEYACRYYKKGKTKRQVFSELNGMFTPPVVGVIINMWKALEDPEAQVFPKWEGYAAALREAIAE